MKIIVATHNGGKLAEIRRILEERLGADAADIELVSAGSLGLPDPVEDGVTFQENALIKARDVAERTGCPAVADDSGLMVDALDGAPGVHSARYASDGHDFAANNRLLLRNLEGVANRRARFRTVISLLVGDEEHLFEGVVEGRIVERESGAEGFGYDPLFVPDGCDRTFAEMSPDEKNAVSHRGNALRQLRAKLQEADGANA